MADKKIKRIEFYTRKVKELYALHPSKWDEKHNIRYKRLLKYKKAMNDWLNK